MHSCCEPFSTAKMEPSESYLLYMIKSSLNLTTAVTYKSQVLKHILPLGFMALVLLCFHAEVPFGALRAPGA